MELKLHLPHFTGTYLSLLIVPYGIETWEYRWHCRHNRLLIVPYGIETKYHKVNQDARCLLIVPYGIETKIR